MNVLCLYFPLKKLKKKIFGYKLFYDENINNDSYYHHCYQYENTTNMKPIQNNFESIAVGMSHDLQERGLDRGTDASFIWGGGTLLCPFCSL
uniref:Uncharacterized protein n=1 Tax=Anguilla anguilla TaxID=7936 RepID=A0A0E9X6D5_ANGAN